MKSINNSFESFIRQFPCLYTHDQRDKVPRTMLLHVNWQRGMSKYEISENKGKWRNVTEFKVTFDRHVEQQNYANL